jgi:hypothetical protein
MTVVNEIFLNLEFIIGSQLKDPIDGRCPNDFILRD